MEPNVYKVYRALKFKVHEIMYSVNPYLGFTTLGEEMEKHWIQQLAVEGRGLTLANCPYTPLPLSGVSISHLSQSLLGLILYSFKSNTQGSRVCSSERQ